MGGEVGVDVIIIGGGPAGSVAGALLADHGFDVILIERNPYAQKPCGGGIPSAAFEEFGISLDIVKRHVNSIEIVAPSKKRLFIELKGGTIAIVDRMEFDSYLRDRAINKGVRIFYGEFLSFIETGPPVKMIVRIDQKDTELTSRYAIISDGVNSRARHSLGIRPLQTVFTMSMKSSLPLTDCCEFWFDSRYAPGFYAWMFPFSAGVGRIKPDGIKDGFTSFIRDRGIDSQGPYRGYRIPLWSLRTHVLQYGENILLAGDAAGLVMPLTFEGIYYAMSSGNLAAQAIIEKRPSLYKKLWKERFYRRFSIMKLLWTYFSRNDKTMEKLVDIHRIPEVQEAAMELWLRKSVDRRSLDGYIKLLRKIVGVSL